MDLTVYRQASKERDDRIVYKGEDARPYVGENILLVADGLGGASAIRHRAFKSEMADKEKLFDVLFGGIFEPPADEDLRIYVIESFEEFLNISKYYSENVNNIKKSGYFGSRIVSAIFLYLAKQFVPKITDADLEWFSDKKITEEEKQKKLSSYSEYFTNKVKEMLRQVSQNANLIYESSFTGLALLGTTLCATIVYAKEESEYVDAFYFLAGDSRPYMWNEDGLRQVSADQERPDGGMTNYIKANGDFTILCEYRRFEKPCILFNASDGVFDSKHFKISQMAFEKLLLETIRDSQTIEEAGEKLEKTFAEYGTHDDSSTIALKTYGFKNFDMLRDKARSRLNEIEKKFLHKMRDLLEHNYMDEQRNFDEAENARKKAICNALWAHQSIVTYCGEVMLERGDENAPAAELAAIEASIKDDETEIEKKRRELARFIEDRNVAQKSDDGTSGSLKFIPRKKLSFKESEDLADELISGNLAISDLKIPKEETAQKLGELLSSISNRRIQIQDNETKKDSLKAKLAEEEKKRWDQLCELKSSDDILNYAKKKKLISSEEYEKYIEQYPPVGGERSGIDANAEKQSELLKLYDETYFELMRENNDGRRG